LGDVWSSLQSSGNYTPPKGIDQIPHGFTRVTKFIRRCLGEIPAPFAPDGIAILDRSSRLMQIAIP
jgi:hypothetical protein